MVDLISRQAAIEIVRHRCKRLTTACVLAVTEIEQLPPAQPERKKGKWLVDEDGNMECPFCGNTCGFGNYCNECGADMRGNDKE